MKKLYECDASKNASCNKFGCYLNGWVCHLTSNVDCALLDKEGKPIEYTEKTRGMKGDYK